MSRRFPLASSGSGLTRLKLAGSILAGLGLVAVPLAHAQEAEPRPPVQAPAAPAQAPAPAKPPAPQPKVTLELKDVPLRKALELLFTNAGISYSIDTRVQGPPISVSLKNADFQEALRILLEQGRAAGQPALTFTVADGVYRVASGAASSPTAPRPEGEAVEKIPIQFHRAADLFATIQESAVPPGVSTVTTLPADNSLLVTGTREDIDRLREVIRLVDTPASMVTLKISIIGGTAAKPLQLQSTARSLTGREATLSEEATLNGQPVKARIVLKPLVQGDGTVLLDSDWDLNLPVPTANGTTRLVKRLATHTRLVPGQSTAVSEVDLSSFGGAGLVRLWVQAFTLPPDFGRVAYGPEPALRLPVAMVNDVPYVSVRELTAQTGGHLRFSRVTGAYVLSARPESGESAVPEEKPELSQPYRLIIGNKVASRRVQVGRSYPQIGKMVLDPEGDPYVPLSDLALAAGAKVAFEPALDAYRLSGGREVSSLLGIQTTTVGTAATEPVEKPATPEKPLPSEKPAPVTTVPSGTAPSASLVPPVSSTASIPPVVQPVSARATSAAVKPAPTGAKSKTSGSTTSSGSRSSSGSYRRSSGRYYSRYRGRYSRYRSSGSQSSSRSSSSRSSGSRSSSRRSYSRSSRR